jgi:hypothetical protein
VSAPTVASTFARTAGRAPLLGFSTFVSERRVKMADTESVTVAHSATPSRTQGDDEPYTSLIIIPVTGPCGYRQMTCSASRVRTLSWARSASPARSGGRSLGKRGRMRLALQRAAERSAPRPRTLSEALCLSKRTL